jgi:PAS domain S-box-containing protein
MESAVGRLLPSDLGVGRLFDLVAEAVIVGDASTGLVLLWNAAAERTFGYTADEAIGMPIVELVPEESKQAHLAGLARYRRGGTGALVDQGSTVELRALSKDGGELWVELSLTGLHDIPRSNLVLALVRDITARRRAQEELQQSNQDLEQVATFVSHDLAQPLHVIRSFAELLQERLDTHLDDEGRSFFEYILGSASRMEALIDDMLAYSRIASGRPSFDTLDLAAVVTTCLDDLRTSIEEAGAEVSVDPLPAVRADATSTRQLFQNLISNAIKFAHPARPPVVRVSARREDGWTISVADNGLGIEPRHRERVFGMFTRLQSAADYPGTGVGLAMCKKIVERRGGRIWIEDSGEGGTVFSFTIPDRLPAV